MNRRLSGHMATAWATVVSLSGAGAKESSPPTLDSVIACHKGFRSPSMCTKTRAPVSASISASSL